ncbi:hypothetical protein [Mycolicibacterium sp. CR10]|uniref:hypothetical protein n=1 Tax=Mycolicibacterium sp. CR10 TaxID=2562314 RepID=UPI0010C0825A|nr:hypothetical protein [Mycolicibacterium sp. CR10]
MSDEDDVLANSYPPEYREAIAAALTERRRRTAAKVRSRWGAELNGQRAPGYLVVVTKPGRRGRRIKQYSFVLAEDTWDEPGGPHWERVTERFTADIPGAPTRSVICLSEPLPPDTIDIAAGVRLKTTNLRVVLDALASDGRHSIELEDMKVILSQLGSRMTHLNTLPPEKRQHAEPALYAAILARCTSI